MSKRHEIRREKREELHPERKPKPVVEPEVISPEEKTKRSKIAMNSLVNLMGIMSMLGDNKY